jgi:hypothetical protein
MTSIFTRADYTTAASGGQWTNVTNQYNHVRDVDLPFSVKADGRLDSKFLNARSSPQNNGTSAKAGRAPASAHVSTPASAASLALNRTRYDTSLVSPHRNTYSGKKISPDTSPLVSRFSGFRLSRSTDDMNNEEKKQPPREVPARVAQPSVQASFPQPSAPLQPMSTTNRPPAYNPAANRPPAYNPAATKQQPLPLQLQQPSVPFSSMATVARTPAYNPVAMSQPTQSHHDAGTPLEDSPEHDDSFPGPFDEYNRRLTNKEIQTIMRVFVTEHNDRIAEEVDGDLNAGAFVNICAVDKPEQYFEQMTCQSWNNTIDSFKHIIAEAKQRDAYKHASLRGKMATNVAAAGGAVASTIASVPGVGLLGAAGGALKSLVPSAIANVANNAGAKLQGAAKTLTGGVFDTTKPILTASEQEDAVNRIMHDVPQMLAIVKSMNGEGKGTYAVCAFNPHARTFLIVDPFARSAPNGECYSQMNQNMRNMLNDVFSSEDNGNKLSPPTLQYSAYCMNIPLHASKVNGGIWALRLAQQLLSHNFDKDTSKHVQIDQYINNLHKKDIKTSRHVYSKLLYISAVPDDDDDVDYQVRDEAEMISIVKDALYFDGLVA